VNLGKYNSTRKSGLEAFHLEGKKLDSSLLHFWQWSSSEILANTLRGILAEFIVSMDLGCNTDIREEWDAYDLLSQDNIKVEVKSASYLQSWKQDKLSKISFCIQPTYGWDAVTKRSDKELKRQSDVYVFCVLAHKDKLTVDPLNLAQWDFYIVSTKTLDKSIPKQKTITLTALQKFNPIKCKFGKINDAIRSVNT
jgi:hypothetical protein